MLFNGKDMGDWGGSRTPRFSMSWKEDVLEVWWTVVCDNKTIDGDGASVAVANFIKFGFKNRKADNTMGSGSPVVAIVCR